MDLTTEYMGLKLSTPLVPSASPLSDDLANIKAMEEHGAGAVVMESLFEEQLQHEADELDHFLGAGTESFAEALSFFPEADDYRVGPEEYLEKIRKAKEAVSIPVIASLNGVSKGGWMDYAKQIEEAGADALELNIYYIPTDQALAGSAVEEMTVEALRAVKEIIRLPVAVKLGPHYSNMANLAKRLDDAGADALVLFNRFYQPDIDLDKLEVLPDLQLSKPSEIRLSLRWIAILQDKIHADLAATSGIHNHEDALKLIMAGANVTQLCATLLLGGIPRISEIKRNMELWMADKKYESVSQIRGILSQASCGEPAAFERANYMKALTSYK